MSKVMCLVLLSVFASTVSSNAAIDWEKRNANMKRAYSSAIEQVQQNGNAPAKKPFLPTFDSNQDGSIDRSEISAVQTALNKLT